MFMAENLMQDEEKNQAGGGSEGQAAQPPSSEAAASGAEAPRNPNMKWYIIHSYSGFERKVKESLESRVVAFGFRAKSARC